MVQPLPVAEFKFLEHVDNFDIMAVPYDSEIGYILEVCLQYPTELHDLQ